MFAKRGCSHPHAIVGYLGLTVFQHMAKVGSVHTFHSSQPRCICCASSPLSQYLVCLLLLCCIATVRSFALPHHPASAVLHCYCHCVFHAFICATLSLLDNSGFVVPCCICLLRYHHHDACFYHIALPLLWLRLCHASLHYSCCVANLIVFCLYNSCYFAFDVALPLS